MATISTKLRGALKTALTDPGAAKELEATLNKVLNVDDTTRSTAVIPVAVTFTSGAPSTYASPVGTLTVSNGAAPTVAELVAYCNELRKNIVDLQAVLHAKGLTT